MAGPTANAMRISESYTSHFSVAGFSRWWRWETMSLGLEGRTDGQLIDEPSEYADKT